MGIIDLILNVACLLLWLNWRLAGISPATASQPMSLLSTLKTTEKRKSNRWLSLVALLAVLFIRSLVYAEIGPSMDWTPSLHLGAVSIPFRSDYLDRMFFYSGASFLLFIAGFYSWLLLLSALNKQVPDTDPYQRLIRFHLGPLEKLPAGVQLFLPSIAAILGWVAANPLLTSLGMIPEPLSPAHLWQQALVLGGAAFLTWRIVIVAVLALHLLNSYVYLGNLAVWSLVDNSASKLLRFARWLPLRAGKVDFAPLVAIAAVIGLGEFLTRSLHEVYQRLPLV